MRPTPMDGRPRRAKCRGAEVDPAGRTAVALAGSRLMDLDAATAAHGLAAPSGTFVDTGIGGLTLGGGISYIVASEGFACDALIRAELVTAGGEVVEVDEEREPELLWGCATEVATSASRRASATGRRTREGRPQDGHDARTGLTLGGRRRRGAALREGRDTEDVDRRHRPSGSRLRSTTSSRRSRPRSSSRRPGAAHRGVGRRAASCPRRSTSQSRRRCR